MRIGILTFHRADNFGAALQSYALQTYLEELGHEVYIIDYRCKVIEQVYYVLNPKLLMLRKNVIKALGDYLFHARNHTDMALKSMAYKNFRNEYLHLIDFSDDINKDMDAYIAGSDQIWNLSLTHGYNNIYFLDFPIQEKTLKISYAASSEASSFPVFAQYKDKIHHALDSFDFLSVREPALKEELKKYTHKDIRICVDPTFLLEKEYYEKILEKPNERDYVLIYHMAETEDAVNLADKISRTKGLQVIEIHSNFKSSSGLRHKKHLGPLQILGYIKNADTVITNSFHGTALSLVFNKNLWVINKYKSARLLNILTMAGLTKRYISDIDEFDDSSICYNMVEIKMKEPINDSKRFLTELLIKGKI